MPDSDDNPYLALTREFNRGKTRAIISSRQAVVLHGLAVMSKDGDWILRETEEALQHILTILEQHGAVYRFGAPLALPWMRMGWSSHFEFSQYGLRIRTDFFTRPPRINLDQLAELWISQETREFPVTDLHNLARLKLTNREKDYAVIGEIARRFEQPSDQLLWSRSARDLIQLAVDHPETTVDLQSSRPLLSFAIAGDRDQLETALDKERRESMRANEQRLAAMQHMMADWRAAWPDLQAKIRTQSLSEAHQTLVQSAQSLLPSE
jgi:hypothetical protein